MPSHIAHTAFAVESLSILGREGLLATDKHQFLVLGAQGPDIFYHNQRTRPSGISFGSLLHRRSYGSFCAEVLAWLIEENLGPDSPPGKYLLGFVTHAVLDRYLHPYINFFAGWYDPTIPETERYRFAHPFLERILDVRAIALPTYKMQSESWGLYPPHSGRQNFGEHASLGSELPTVIQEFLRRGLGRIRPKALEDASFTQRLKNAYSDALGFYKFCDSSQNARVKIWKQVAKESPEIRAQALGSIESIQWTALLHPLALPPTLDPLNNTGRNWKDPCGFEEHAASSAMQLWADAVKECAVILETILGLWEKQHVPEGFQGLAPLIGDSGLRNRSSGPELCKMEYSEPLDFRSVLEVLDSGRIPADWLDLSEDRNQI